MGDPGRRLCLQPARSTKYNRIDESDNDEISAKPEALNTLCGLVCVPQGVPHILEVPFDLIHDLNPDLEATLEAVERDEEYKIDESDNDAISSLSGQFF